MSGKRQHILPQFLVKGFSSRSAHSNHFVWVYRKGQAPFESNIINVGVEKNFYSEDDSTIDEKITDAERGYAELLNELRRIKKSELINKEMLPYFIAHLEIRTRNVRESLIEISDLSKPLKNTPRLAAGMNSCLSEGVIRGTGKSPLSA
jgi:hypothetical protein